MPDAVDPMWDGDPDDVDPEIPCDNASSIAAPVVILVIPADADPCKWMSSWCVVRDYNQPILLLRDPKRASIGCR